MFGLCSGHMQHYLEFYLCINTYLKKHTTIIEVNMKVNKKLFLLQKVELHLEPKNIELATATLLHLYSYSIVRHESTILLDFKKEKEKTGFIMFQYYF